MRQFINFLVILLLIMSFTTFVPEAFAQNITASFNQTSYTGAVNSEFTASLRIRSDANQFIRLYQIYLNFNKDVLEVMGIDYRVGVVSVPLGGDDGTSTNLTAINGRSPGEVRLFGEVQIASGQQLASGQNVEFVRITFKIKNNTLTTISTANNSTIMVINQSDFSLQNLSLSTQAQASVNQVGAAGTASFRIAESPTALSSAFWQAYTSHPMPYTHPLAPPLNSGDSRVIYVEFKASDGRTQTFNKTFRYTPDPTITRVDCTHSPTGVGTNITIKGVNLGPQGNNGKVKVAGSEIDVTSWDEATNTITLSVGQRLEGRQAVNVTLDDGRNITKNCTINLTTVEFETLTQCKTPGQFSASNVDVKVFERQPAALTTPEPIQRQKITIDGSGKPQGFVPKFERGKNYTLLIKFPVALAKKAEFKAEGGTTILDTISFAVGDIAPATSPDGKINAFDKSELIRQWSIGRDVSKTGDFNRDSRINSIDYACMRVNFNASDETYSPLTVQTSPSPTSPASSPTASPSASPSFPPAGGGGIPVRVSFDPSFPTAQTQQGNLDPATGQVILNLTLPSGPGPKPVYIQFRENDAWVPATPVTSTIILTGIQT